MSRHVNALREFGNTHRKQTSHLCYDRLPECPPTSPLVLPRPRLTTRTAPERKRRPTMSKSPRAVQPPPRLADVDREVRKGRSLSATRRRDLRSAVSRVASLLGEDPARLPLDLRRSPRLAAVNAVAAGISQDALATSAPTSRRRAAQRAQPVWRGQGRRCRRHGSS